MPTAMLGKMSRSSSCSSAFKSEMSFVISSSYSAFRSSDFSLVWKMVRYPLTAKSISCALKDRAVLPIDAGRYRQAGVFGRYVLRNDGGALGAAV